MDAGRVCTRNTRCTARRRGDMSTSFNHRRSLDSGGPPSTTATMPRSDGLATIGLINGRDWEGRRPPSDPPCLTRRPAARRQPTDRRTAAANPHQPRWPLPRHIYRSDGAGGATMGERSTAVARGNRSHRRLSHLA